MNPLSGVHVAEGKD